MGKRAIPPHRKGSRRREAGSPPADYSLETILREYRAAPEEAAGAPPAAGAVFARPAPAMTTPAEETVDGEAIQEEYVAEGVTLPRPEESAAKKRAGEFEALRAMYAPGGTAADAAPGLEESAGSAAVPETTPEQGGLPVTEPFEGEEAAALPDAPQSEDDRTETAVPENAAGESAPDAEAAPGEALSEPPDAAGETQSAPLSESVEGFEEDAELYSALPAADEEAAEPGGEEYYVDEDYAIHPSRRGARGGFFQRLRGRMVAVLTVASFRREQRRTARGGLPEDSDKEMPAAQAARLYASQMPSLKNRSRLAFALSLLPLWIALGYGLGWPLPGLLARDVRCAALVSGVALLAVMLAALDVFTGGMMALFRLRPGGETLIAFSALLCLADVVYTVAAKEPLGQLPPCVLPCLALSFALRGAWHSCRGYRASFLAVSRAESAYVVSSEHLMGRKSAFLIRCRRDTSGFVRRSEEPDGCETISAVLAPFLMPAVLVLAGLLAVLSKSVAVLPHALAILSCVCPAWCALFSFPRLFAAQSLRFAQSGAALAGWPGVRDVGNSQHLILTDSDIFPQGTYQLASMRILEGIDKEKAISYTGSMLSAAGTEIASLFTDVMQHRGYTMRAVEEFTVGEGGAMAYIGGEEICVGSAGYMHLRGVKISPKLLSNAAIYLSFSRALVGIFNIDYQPTPSVQQAMLLLQRNRRQPIFAARDFNIDPLLIRDLFACSTDGFEFPSVPERYKISEKPVTGESPAAGVILGGGLGRLVEMSDRGRYLYFCGVAFEIMTAVCALLGLAGGFLLCYLEMWSLLSVTRMLLYMFVWTLPGFLLGLRFR